MNCKLISKTAISLFLVVILALSVLGLNTVVTDNSRTSSTDTGDSRDTEDSSGSNTDTSDSSADTSDSNTDSSDSDNSRSDTVSDSDDWDKVLGEYEIRPPSFGNGGSRDIAIEEVSVEDRFIIREKLNLSKNFMIRERVLKKLIQKKNEDNANFNRVVQLTNNLVKTGSEKEVFADDVSDMNKKFIEKLYERTANKAELQKLRVQVRNYVNIVENREQIKAEVSEIQIKDLFDKKKDIDSLIEEIWED